MWTCTGSREDDSSMGLVAWDMFSGNSFMSGRRSKWWLSNQRGPLGDRPVQGEYAPNASVGVSSHIHDLELEVNWRPTPSE